MRLFFISILLFFIFIGTAPNVWAGNEIIDYLSGIIYDDCEGFDVMTNYDVIWIGPAESKKRYMISDTDPVKKEKIKELIAFLVNNEPYTIDMGGPTISTGKDGMGIAWCGDKKLDINFNTYYWNNERVDPFIYNVNQTVQTAEERIIQNIENYITQEGEGPKSAAIGEGSTSKATEINTFSKNQIIVGFTLTIVFSIAFSYYLIYKKITKHPD